MQSITYDLSLEKVPSEKPLSPFEAARLPSQKSLSLALAKEGPAAAADSHKSRAPPLLRIAGEARGGA